MGLLYALPPYNYISKYEVGCLMAKEKKFEMFVLTLYPNFVRARRNLIFVSLLAIAATWIGLKPEEILTIQMKDITEQQQSYLLYVWCGAAVYFLIAYVQAWWIERQYFYLGEEQKNKGDAENIGTDASSETVAQESRAKAYLVAREKKNKFATLASLSAYFNSVIVPIGLLIAGLIGVLGHLSVL